MCSCFGVSDQYDQYVGKVELVEDQKNGGLMQVALSDEGQNDPAVQLILSSLELGLKDIEQSYPKYIKTNIN